MKKLLLILLCLPLLFSSCQEDDPTPSVAPPSSSALYGNVAVIIDGTSQVFAPLSASDCQATVQTIQGTLNLIQLQFQSYCNNNWIEFDYHINVTANAFSTNSFYEGQYSEYSCSTSPFLSAVYLGGASANGIVNITNIDYSNQEISGNFSLYGQGKPTIECTFSNMPFTLMAI
tara:strand:+ start:494 stop:1015 length:522 start_codon:yes stop_codon:yes gene_type:complete